MKVLFYRLASGRIPVLEFLQALETRPRAETFRVLERIGLVGTSSPVVSARQVRGKLWEIRIRSGAEVRIFYVAQAVSARTDEEEAIILLHAYVKKSQKAPKHEIELAERRLKEVLR